MSVASIGSSTSAYSYLQSLLPSAGNAGPTDPVSQLLAAFYPSGQNDPLTAPPSAPGTNTPAAGPASPGAGGFDFSPDTMSTLISLQGQLGDPSVTSQAQSLFSQFDANGDGQISQSEFEKAFGSNSDTSKVDGLFNSLDSNGDGSVSQDEMTSAAQQSHAAHHHHHHAHGGGGGQGGGGGGGGLSDLLSSTDATGATSQTTNNADGSTTTSIKYADGSTIDMTTPAASSSGSGTSGGSSNVDRNLLEQMIRYQSQLLTPTAGQDLATI